MALDCLIINLTRFGDLIQSQSLLTQMRKQGLRIGLVCQENFVQTTKLLTGLSRVWALPGALLLREIDHSWKEAVYRLRSFCDDIQKEETIHSVLNITPTTAARLLSVLLAPSTDKIVGFGLDKDGFGINRGGWATFLQASTACRQNAVFNIADMFRKLASPILKEPLALAPKIRLAIKVPDEEAQREARALLQTTDRPAEKPISGYIAMQLGASKSCRQWPTAYFAELGDRIWAETGFCPVLTGTKQEQKLAYEYAQLSHAPFRSLVGQTSLPVLAALLSQVKVLVSNDTGTLHLASALLTPSVSFFLATAQVWDTGPALPGCLCFEPDIDCHPCDFSTPCQKDAICQKIIRPEPVAQILISWLRGVSFSESVQKAQEVRARIWETTSDSQGMCAVKALSEHAKSPRTEWIRLQRLFWSQFLDNQPAAPLSPNHVKSSFFADIASGLTNALHILTALGQQFALIGKSKNAPSLLLRNCDRLQAVFMGNPHLVGFSYFWRELRLDQGENLNDFATNIERFRQHLCTLLAAVSEQKT